MTNTRQQASILRNLGLKGVAISAEKRQELEQVGVVASPEVLAILTALKDNQEEPEEKT